MLQYLSSVDHMLSYLGDSFTTFSSAASIKVGSIATFMELHYLHMHSVISQDLEKFFINFILIIYIKDFLYITCISEM